VTSTTRRIDPALNSLHVHYFSLEAAKKILNVLSRHSSPRFFPRHKEVAIFIRIFERHKASAPAFFNWRRNVRSSPDQIIVKLIDIFNSAKKCTPRPRRNIVSRFCASVILSAPPRTFAIGGSESTLTDSTSIPSTPS
jgi:hypothetical protein